MNRFDLILWVLIGLILVGFFAPVLLGPASLVPFDNLYSFPPWKAAAAQMGVQQPHNELLSDLVLENYAWKTLILQALRQGEIPLWNPYLFAGLPFLSAGQSSALYPFSVLFLLLPLDRAYGYFVALQLWLAALGMYVLLRLLRVSRLGATVGALTYALSGFMVVSVVFPMVLGAAAWLPAILACLERVFQHEGRRIAGEKVALAGSFFWVLLAALLVGLQFLSGHFEISYYVLMVTGLYALWRIAGLAFRGSRRGARAILLLSLTGLGVGLGIALAAVQLIPAAELAQRSFREGASTYTQVVSYAFPARQVLTFLMPDFFGNPADHSYVDVFDFTTRAAPTGTIFWGSKNYVEAGAYVGILPLALALLAIAGVLGTLRGTRTRPGEPPSTWRAQALFFFLLAVVSLLLAFGTPLYAILYYVLPGYTQLHTPFRWVFPFTLAMAALAGMGADLAASYVREQTGEFQRLVQRVGWLVFGAGGLTLTGLGLSWVFREPTLALAQRVIDASDLAGAVFASGRMFYSYEARPVLLLGIWLVVAGALLLWRPRLFSAGRQTAARRPQAQPVVPRPVVAFLRSPLLWPALLVAVVVADLSVAGFRFNPAADPRLGAYVPPAVRFLQQDTSLYRITTYDLPGEKVFNPNAGMFYGIADVRGYDSIIPRQYTDYMGWLAPQDELLNNRIAAFYQYQPLSSPLLNLLNVKYVLTTRAVPNPGYTLAYDGEIKIYRNENVLPRAFLVPQARVIPDRDELAQAMQTFDPRREVLIEETPAGSTPAFATPPAALPPVQVESYHLNQVDLRADVASPAWLVLTDSYFPGWTVQVDGQDAHLYRADWNFRAVQLPAGEHTIRYRYSPLSFRVGAVVSLLAGLVIALGLATITWQRVYRGSTERGAVRVIAKNSVIPIAASLITQLLSFAFLPLLLRILGPENNGRYAFAVTTWLIVSTITDFGLGILVTREVSRDRSLANRYLTNTAVLRLALALAALPFLLLGLYVYGVYLGLTADTAVTILILWASLLPATLASALSYMFNAFEQFEYPNIVAVGTALVSTALQAAVLLLGGGIVGLAAVSVVSNLFTLSVVYWLVRTRLFVPRWEWDRTLVRWMFFESYPLMLNNLLANFFFRVDVFILKPLAGDLALGYYSTAYKFINALNVIPSNFTLALFPLFSRYAGSAKEAMQRAYLLSVKLLLWTALPITVLIVFGARELVLLFGGLEYLPDSQIALQWLIWFLPFSFVNSVTHYVLIALNQQRFLTKAFLVGLGFNLAANLLAIPALSYRGAALVTVLSELALLIPFYIALRRASLNLPLAAIAWRPVLAAAVMWLAIFFLQSTLGLVPAMGLGALLYVGVLLGLGAVQPDEWRVFRRLLPSRG